MSRRVVSAPLGLMRYLFSLTYNDRILAQHLRITPGELPFAGRVAVYLIFPGDGLLPTHRRAIRYLSDNNYAPVIVSNLPLSPEDRQDLAKTSSTVIERRNFGYDFGGYRAAMLWLAAKLPTMKRLVLLNDSTWFPLPTGRNWLAEVEALGVDFGAATWTGAVERPAPWEYETMEWTVNKERRNFHYASYALAFSERILADAEFLRFWRKLRLTQAKNSTVRRGEIGLTRWIMRRGYSHAATDELADLGQRLAALQDAEIEHLLENLIILEDQEMEACLAGLRASGAGAPDYRARAEKLILTVTARRGAAYALAHQMVCNERFPFLKKSPARGVAASAAIMDDILGSLSGDICQEIRDEIAWH